MKKIDVAIIEALTEALNKSIKQYMASLGSDSENTNLFKMNFIKKLFSSIWIDKWKEYIAIVKNNWKKGK